MARGSQKRIAAGNAGALSTLAYGFAISNTVHLLLNFYFFRASTAGQWRPVTLYGVSEGVAAVLALQLVAMARSGDDLSQAGLTACVVRRGGCGSHGRYMFDVIYITWFVHVMTAVVSRHFWWTYAVIPAYAAYLAYTKVLVPFVFRGQSPLAAFRRTPEAGTASEANAQPAVSKRQAKQQARAERGGTRTQVRRGR